MDRMVHFIDLEFFVIAFLLAAKNKVIKADLIDHVTTFLV